MVDRFALNCLKGAISESAGTHSTSLIVRKVVWSCD